MWKSAWQWPTVNRQRNLKQSKRKRRGGDNTEKSAQAQLGMFEKATDAMNTGLPRTWQKSKSFNVEVL
jgi:hypothetical protein